ncbi:hypothetical protein Pelo_17093 [Pelomyxa schiedti]|nr:hypothetical protein Pelo_17093 [Pelomyxa schiedti]
MMSQQSSTMPVWKQQQQRQERRGYILSVSLMVWRDIVPLAVPTGVRGEWRVGDCVGLMALADALFPLVPRACKAVMGAGAVEESDDYDGNDDVSPETKKGKVDVVVVHTSRYFGLRCAGLAGSKRCAEWIVGHAARTRNNDKECLTVLKGLCAGGHLAVAQELVDGTTYYFKSLRWPGMNPDIADSLREMSETCKSLLFEACKGGNLDAVKWVMSRFGGVGTEDWELIKPFQCAVRRGHVDIVKWLASTTGVLGACRKYLKPENLLGSASVEVVKLCMEWFFSGGAKIPALVGTRTLLKYMELAQQRDDTEFEEGCQWIKNTFKVPINSHLLGVRSYKGLKWVLDNVPQELTKPELMKFSSKLLADEEIMSSCITELSPVTPQDLVAVCGNEKDNVETVKFILSMTTTAPTAKDLQACLVQALSVNNTSIAEWLENTFHVMSVVNSDPFNTGASFSQICWNHPGSRGMHWFLSHAKLGNISPDTVEGAVTPLRKKPHEFGAVLDTFPVVRRFRVYTVACAVESWSLSQTMHFVSPNRGGFVADKIARGLKGSGRVQSGKVVRWLIQSFLPPEQVTCGYVMNNLMRVLIDSNKVTCAEWLLRTCKISFDDLMATSPLPWNPAFRVASLLQAFKQANISVPMWKMLLRVFPQITGAFVKEHLMRVVFLSPLHTTVSMRTLGLTNDDILARKDT